MLDLVSPAYLSRTELNVHNPVAGTLKQTLSWPILVTRETKEEHRREK